MFWILRVLNDTLLLELDDCVVYTRWKYIAALCIFILYTQWSNSSIRLSFIIEMHNVCTLMMMMMMMMMSRFVECVKNTQTRCRSAKQVGLQMYKVFTTCRQNYHLYRRHCVRWGPSSPSKRSIAAPAQLFDPSLLWPNGWTDQDATWYGSRPRFRRRCVRWDRSPPQKGHSPPPHFLPIYVWPTAVWIKMPLVT